MAPSSDSKGSPAAPAAEIAVARSASPGVAGTAGSASAIPARALPAALNAQPATRGGASPPPQTLNLLQPQSQQHLLPSAPSASLLPAGSSNSSAPGSPGSGSSPSQSPPQGGDSLASGNLCNCQYRSVRLFGGCLACRDVCPPKRCLRLRLLSLVVSCVFQAPVRRDIAGPLASGPLPCTAAALAGSQARAWDRWCLLPRLASARRRPSPQMVCPLACFNSPSHPSASCFALICPPVVVRLLSCGRPCDTRR